MEIPGGIPTPTWKSYRFPTGPTARRRAEYGSLLLGWVEGRGLSRHPERSRPTLAKTLNLRPVYAPPSSKKPYKLYNVVI